MTAWPCVEMGSGNTTSLYHIDLIVGESVKAAKLQRHGFPTEVVDGMGYIQRIN